jgi:hypothetical protein
LSATTATSTDARTAPISRSLTIEEALTTLSKSSETLIHSPLIESEAFYRLRNYPSHIEASLHHALISIPRKLAYILHNRPAAIAPAVEAFYLRDPIALKPLQKLPSKLIFPPEDLVTVSTRFTKVLYAQVKSQQFSTPLAWRELIPYSMGDEDTGMPVEKKEMQLQMGMKITSGFEMLISDPKNVDNQTVRETKIVLDDIAAKNDILPTDSEINDWKDVNREDDDKWLDINFEDFDRELRGNNGDAKSAKVFGPEPPPSFGDATTQEDLKKMVERFESFLNDENAGVDGAELDDMDFDNDGGDFSEDDSEDEDKDVSFDENEFAKMMREMMGMPPEGIDGAKGSPFTMAHTKSEQSERMQELDSDEEDEEEEAKELSKVMQRMEAELKAEGALNLDPIPKKVAILKDKSKSNEKGSSPREDWEDESDDEDANIDFNLAKNLLKSFKSQVSLVSLYNTPLTSLFSRDARGDSGNVYSANKMNRPAWQVQEVIY